MAAVGLEMHDLFVPRAGDTHSRGPRASALTPLIATFERDLLMVHALLARIGAGKMIVGSDIAAASAAATRIFEALAEARHVL